MSLGADGMAAVAMAPRSVAAVRARWASRKTPEPCTAERIAAEVTGRWVGMALSSTARAA
ncbi:MAG: hypothetical protein B7X77_00740 [Caulobacter sp. 39-67-4]|nr:MAG: hypothetical protein B7X77_00740 [Caulobacter sp. 39-67-4]